MKALEALTLAAAVILGGCAVHRVETPTAVPKSAPPAAPAPPPKSVPARVVAPGESSAPESTVPSAVPAAPAAPKPQEAAGPSATESSYVFGPQQAAVSSRPAPPVPVAPSPAPAAAPGGDAPSAEGPENSEGPEDTEDAADPADTTPGRIQLSVIASAAEIAAGSIMTVDVMASSSGPVLDAPLHLAFDPNVVQFVDGTVGDFLAQGGSSVVFIADGATRPGDVAVAAGRVERARGASGSGLLCRLRFRGTGPGTTSVAVSRAKAWGVDGRELVVSTAGTIAVVR